MMVLLGCNVMSEPFLCNLGISEKEQLQDPRSDSLPSALNPNCSAEWSEVVRKVLSLGYSGLAAWGICIRSFVKLCTDQNKFAFLRDPNSINESILSIIQKQRDSVINFLTLNAELSKVIETAIVSRISRDVVFLGAGFIICCKARLRLDFLETAELAEKLCFTKISEGCYRKDVGSGVSVELCSDTNNAAYTQLCYSIRSDQLPWITNNYTPSQAEYTKFILDIMYIPLIKMSSPSIFSTKLF